MYKGDTVIVVACVRAKNKKANRDRTRHKYKVVSYYVPKALSYIVCVL